MTLRPSNERQAQRAGILFQAPAFVILLTDHSGHVNTFEKSIIAAIFVIWMPMAVLAIGQLLWIRIELNDRRIAEFSWRNRLVKEAEPSDILAYRHHKDAGWFIVFRDGRNLALRQFRPDEVHRFALLEAPKSIVWKRYVNRITPPEAEQKDLPIINSRFLILVVLFVGLVTAAIVFHRPLVLCYAGNCWLLSYYFCVDLATKIDITSEGVVERRGSKRRGIAWEELKAVFHERTDKFSEFVLVSESTTIRLTSDTLATAISRRKLFGNIPEGTKCVNWENLGFRKRRKRVRLRLRLPLLRPVLLSPTKAP